ncbi:Fmp25 [Kluyveromyces lactis]|nr:Fmp25 [Kluyveromyces lactis]
MFRPIVRCGANQATKISYSRCGHRLVNGFHSSAVTLLGKEPKYDDAEIMAERLNNADYVGKRDKTDYQWKDKSEAQSEKEYFDRMEKLAKLYAVLQGLLFVGGVSAIGTAYMMWPQIKNWWMTEDIHVSDDVIEKLKEKKERRKLTDIPVVPANSADSSVVGLYYWGQRLGTDSKRAVTKFPLRVPFFDGMKLRDVCLTDDKSYGNLAVDKDGNLFEWDNSKCNLLLKDQNLVQVKVSNDVAYGLNKKGEVLVIPLKDKSLFSDKISWSRSMLLPWKTYCRYSWKLDTRSAFRYSGEKKVVQFDVGSNHLVLLSNKGKAYTCATGTKHVENERSKGQFGIPMFSQFDPYPELNRVYEIELLNTGIAGDHVTSRSISKIACGDYHTLACDSVGELYSFGLNTYGQLGQSISYDMEHVPFPKKVSSFSGHFEKHDFLKCVEINCSGNTSFVSILPQDVHRYFKNKDFAIDIDNDKDNITYFAFGNGIQGQLGNGHFKHSQSTPTRMKVINDLKDNTVNSNKRILIKDWYCGEQHAFVRLENGEIMCWGYNENGQLGNGKKIKWDKPAYIPRLLEPGERFNGKNLDILYDENNKLVISDEQSLRAGKEASCLFWKA